MSIVKLRQVSQRVALDVTDDLVLLWELGFDRSDLEMNWLVLLLVRKGRVELFGWCAESSEGGVRKFG